VDIRADLYSLGCTLYFLLAGRPPFAEGTAIEKILKHQLDPVPPVRQYRPDVPAEVEELLLRMLAKQPQDRPSSALEVAQELEKWCRYPFSLHPSPLLIRQQGPSSPSLRSSPPPETESALRGQTDPQVTPPGSVTSPGPTTPAIVPSLVSSRMSPAPDRPPRQQRTPSTPQRLQHPVPSPTTLPHPAAPGYHRVRRPLGRRPGQQQDWWVSDRLLVIVLLICMLLAVMLGLGIWLLR